MRPNGDASIVNVILSRAWNAYIVPGSLCVHEYRHDDFDTKNPLGMRATRRDRVSVLLMTEAAATTEAEFWHVQLPSGEVRYMSLEELDAAFQRDEITAKTFVLKEGEKTWQKLGELLGLDEVAADSVAVPVAPYSIGSVPPQSMPSSIRPVVADVVELEDDDVVAAMKPKRKNIAFIGGGVAAALLVAVVGLTSASSGSDAPVAAAAAQPPPPVVTAPPPAADPAPQATLSEDMKRQLLEADKARAAKAAAKAAENAKYRTTATSYRQPKSAQPFHKGGNKFDPLSTEN
jgi:hypothetical protein